jgi:hypothetical protein
LGTIIKSSGFSDKASDNRKQVYLLKIKDGMFLRKCKQNPIVKHFLYYGK